MSSLRYTQRELRLRPYGEKRSQYQEEAETPNLLLKHHSNEVWVVRLHKVIILPLSTEEKRNYPAGWNNYMDKYENHEGVITQVVAGWPDTYEISGTNFYQWHASHLVPPTVFVPY